MSRAGFVEKGETGRTGQLGICETVSSPHLGNSSKAGSLHPLCKAALPLWPASLSSPMFELPESSFLVTGHDRISEVTHYSTTAQVTSAEGLV